MASDVTAPGEITALLGRGTSYSGKLTFEGRVRIDGQFEGEVFSPGTLVIGEGAEIRGTVDVGTLLVLGGEVWGEVMARKLVEVHAAAIVHANIETPQVFIDRGAVFDGRCTMGDDAPSERHELSGEQLLEELSDAPVPSSEDTGPFGAIDPQFAEGEAAQDGDGDDESP